MNAQFPFSIGGILAAELIHLEGSFEVAQA
jgi:hypothetical protein